MSASQKWRKPKPSQQKTSEASTSSEDKASMLRLTEYADELLANGHLEIYQDTFEKLSFLIKQDAEKKEQEAAKRAPAADDLDMFADVVSSAKTSSTEKQTTAANGSNGKQSGL